MNIIKEAQKQIDIPKLLKRIEQLRSDAQRGYDYQLKLISKIESEENVLLNRELEMLKNRANLFKQTLLTLEDLGL